MVVLILEKYLVSAKARFYSDKHLKQAFKIQLFVITECIILFLKSKRFVLETKKKITVLVSILNFKKNYAN